MITQNEKFLMNIIVIYSQFLGPKIDSNRFNIKFQKKSKMCTKYYIKNRIKIREHLVLNFNCRVVRSKFENEFFIDA